MQQNQWYIPVAYKRLLLKIYFVRLFIEQEHIAMESWKDL
jgi:hypothetical protein